MKLLQINPTLKAESGGPAESAKIFAREVLKLGHQITSCTLDRDEPANFPGQVVALGPCLGTFSYSSDLVAWLREHVSDFDAVIVRGLWQYHGFAARQVCRQKQVPYYVFAHGMLDPWFRKNYPLKHLKKQVYWLLAQYQVLRDASAVLFTSEEERLLARKSFWPYQLREKVVNYGSDQPSRPFTELTSEFYAAYPQLSAKRIVLFLGRIHEKKGCDLLLRSFIEASKSDARLQLVFAGPTDSALVPKLQGIANRAGLESRVTFTGMLKGDLKWGAFAAAEVFCLPSHQENFGIAVAESLACATPVLISNKVNIWREVLEDNAGLVADDTQAGTNQLLQQWLALSSGEQADLRRAARGSYESHFNIANSAASILRVLESN